MTLRVDLGVDPPVSLGPVPSKPMGPPCGLMGKLWLVMQTGGFCASTWTPRGKALAWLRVCYQGLHRGQERWARWCRVLRIWSVRAWVHLMVTLRACQVSVTHRLVAVPSPS